MGCQASAYSKDNGSDKSSTDGQRVTRGCTLLESLQEQQWPFDAQKSTEEAYGRKVNKWSEDVFTIKYRSQRMALDSTYHWLYSLDRQAMQDKLIDDVLNDCRHTELSPFPWVVFTAGPMGAGKGYVLDWMESQGYFPRKQFVSVDPDEIRRCLPEWEEYVAHDEQSAGGKTQKEASMLAELCVLCALQKRYNIVIDGSLRDATWYEGYFARLRKGFPGVRIAILHVSAPVESIKANVQKRFLVTGRMVPEDKMLLSIESVPRSVQCLAPLTDFCCCIENNSSLGPPALKREQAASHPPSNVQLDWQFFKSLWYTSSLASTAHERISEGELRSAIRNGLIRKTTVKSMNFLDRNRVSHDEMRCAFSIAARGSLKSEEEGPEDVHSAF
jgi:hypothetical protein